MTRSANSYSVLKSAIAGEISQGLLSLKAAYQRQVVVTHWNVGRVLNEALDLDGASHSTENSRVIRRLSRDFKRTVSFFYTVSKFNRLYPQLPEGNLRWTHYVHLIRVDDDKKRSSLEARALRQNIAGYRLGLLVSDRIQKEAASLLAQGLKPDAVNKTLPLKRGRLYHYQVHKPAAGTSLEGRLLVDLGFSIERDVATSPTAKILPGYIVRVVKNKENYSIRKSRYEPERLYTYKAAVLKVVDGDTLTARIDAGFRTWVTEKIRLRGIDCAEVSCTQGLAAKQYVRKQLDGAGFIIVKTYKQEKFGRFLGDVFYLKGEPDPAVVAERGTFLNQELLDTGHADLYEEDGE